MAQHVFRWPASIDLRASRCPLRLSTVLRHHRTDLLEIRRPSALGQSAYAEARSACEAVSELQRLPRTARSARSDGPHAEPVPAWLVRNRDLERPEKVARRRSRRVGTPATH